MRSKLLGAIAVSTIAAAALTACGGGGESAGDTPEPYKIKVTALPSDLPLNYSRVLAVGTPATNPYWSVIRVEVKKGHDPVTIDEENEEDALNCSVDHYGIGAIFDPEGEEVNEDTGAFNLYRSKFFGASAGIATFGLLAGDTQGTVRVTCAVRDPRSGQETSNTAVVRVGYATRRPAQINVAAIGDAGDGVPTPAVPPVPLAPRDTLTLQVDVLDAALQWVPDGTNVHVQILQREGQIPANPANPNTYGSISADPNSPVWTEARLHDDPIGGAAAIRTTTINGVAQVPLTAGPNTGCLAILATADRGPNNMPNGNPEDPVQSVYYIDVGGTGLCN